MHLLKRNQLLNQFAQNNPFSFYLVVTKPVRQSKVIKRMYSAIMKSEDAIFFVSPIVFIKLS